MCVMAAAKARGFKSAIAAARTNAARMRFDIRNGLRRGVGDLELVAGLGKFMILDKWIIQVHS